MTKKIQTDELMPSYQQSAAYRQHEKRQHQQIWSRPDSHPAGALWQDQ